jgi:hypothetical protein
LSAHFFRYRLRTILRLAQPNGGADLFQAVFGGFEIGGITARKYDPSVFSKVSKTSIEVLIRIRTSRTAQCVTQLPNRKNLTNFDVKV